MISTLTMCSLDFDEKYVRHYLDHYNRQGADRHYLIFHAKKPVEEKEIVARYGAGNVFISFLYGGWNADISVNTKHTLVKNIPNRAEEWFIHSDIDEQAECFAGTLKQKIEKMKSLKQHFCWGRMVDRIKRDGSIKKIIGEEGLSEQFPERANLGRKILKCDTRKVVICRGDIFLGAGNHRPLNKYRGSLLANREILTINHYKWAENVIDKLEERVRTHDGVFIHSKESERLLKFWGEHRKLKN